MNSLERFLEGPSGHETTQANASLAIRKLACNKDIRIFLTSLCKYNKEDWASLMSCCRILFGVFQSSALIQSDSNIMDELVRTPHIAKFFSRLTEE